MGQADIPFVEKWAIDEGFYPGRGDLLTYFHADPAGSMVGCLNGRPIGCIVGARFDNSYGFIGLFLVIPEQRGHGYGLALWKRALRHLDGLTCIGLEAAPRRQNDYASWGFKSAFNTLRWCLDAAAGGNRTLCSRAPLPPGFCLLPGSQVSEAAIQSYDAKHEATPRPLFLREWLQTNQGNQGSAWSDTVTVLLDELGCCRGFARIRPCLPTISGKLTWRLGPWLADASALAGVLLDDLCSQRQGEIIVDAPEANPRAYRLLEERGFKATDRTIRMYRGHEPSFALHDVYGLTCLELG